MPQKGAERSETARNVPKRLYLTEKHDETAKKPEKSEKRARKDKSGENGQKIEKRHPKHVFGVGHEWIEGARRCTQVHAGCTQVHAGCTQVHAGGTQVHAGARRLHARLFVDPTGFDPNVPDLVRFTGFLPVFGVFRHFSAFLDQNRDFHPKFTFFTVFAVFP